MKFNVELFIRSILGLVGAIRDDVREVFKKLENPPVVGSEAEADDRSTRKRMMLNRATLPCVNTLLDSIATTTNDYETRVWATSLQANLQELFHCNPVAKLYGRVQGHHWREGQLAAPL